MRNTILKLLIVSVTFVAFLIPEIFAAQVEYQFVKAWPSIPGLGLPYAVAVDSSGNIYVSDWEHHRIAKLSQDGDVLLTWGKFGSGPDHFASPCGLATDSAGNVYVVDMGNNCIHKYSSNGVFIKKWGARGGENGNFWDPLGVAVDNSGNVYVADSGSHLVICYSLICSHFLH